MGISGSSAATVAGAELGGVFRDFLLKRLPVHELVPHIRDGFGRPSKDLYVALGALILQQMHDLTDQQTSEAISLNIAWHYALDIRHEPDAYLCERTLRNYRSKVLELGLDEVLFRFGRRAFLPVRQILWMEVT